LQSVYSYYRVDFTEVCQKYTASFLRGCTHQFPGVSKVFIFILLNPT